MPNKITPIPNNPPIEGRISGNPPPRASLVNPSNPQALGVILLANWNQDGNILMSKKLPPRMPNVSINAMPMVPAWPGVFANAVMIMPQPTAPATAVITSSNTGRGLPQSIRNNKVLARIKINICKQPVRKMPNIFPSNT